MAIGTDLFNHAVDGNDVQYLLGRKDRRPTAHYNRKEKKVARNLVDRIIDTTERGLDPHARFAIPL